MYVRQAGAGPFHGACIVGTANACRSGGPYRAVVVHANPAALLRVSMLS
jgi:hypothetical protein